MSIIKFHQLSDYHSNDMYTNNVKGSKKITLKSRAMGNVFNPYDGVVVSLHSNDCKNGFLRIAHKIGDMTYFSEFCNIGRVKVGRGDVIKTGKVIGSYLNETDEVEYKLKIKNSLGFEKISPFEFFTGVSIDSKEPIDKDKSSDFDIKKQSKKPNSQNDDDDDEDNNSYKKYNPSNNNSLFLGLALSPLDMFDKGVKKTGKFVKDETKKSLKNILKFKDKKQEKKKEEDDKKKEEEEKSKVNEHRINEQIQRIKKLL